MRWGKQRKKKGEAGNYGKEYNLAQTMKEKCGWRHWTQNIRDINGGGWGGGCKRCCKGEWLVGWIMITWEYWWGRDGNRDLNTLNTNKDPHHTHTNTHTSEGLKPGRHLDTSYCAPKLRSVKHFNGHTSLWWKCFKVWKLADQQLFRFALWPFFLELEQHWKSCWTHT